MNESVQDAIQTLTRLGLNFSQAKVYLALVQMGISTAKEISKASGVNRQEIYRLMPKLQKLGLSEKIICTPTKWKATPIHNGLSVLLERKKKETSELETKATKIISYIIENSEKTEFQQKESRFVMIPKKEAIVRWIRKALDNTQASNDVMGDLKSLNEIIYYLSKNFKKAMKRGVKFRIILNKLEDEKTIADIDQPFKNNPNFHVKYITGIPSVALGIHDKKIAIISTTPKDPNEAPGLTSDNPVFVATLENYFELLWKTAIEQKTKKA